MEWLTLDRKAEVEKKRLKPNRGKGQQRGEKRLF